MARSYYLRVWVPTYPNAGIKVRKEAKTLCTALDLMAKGRHGQAADVMTHRLKGLEKALLDGNWDKAQFVELVDADASTLMSKEEEVWADNDLRLQRRLSSSRPFASSEKGKGKSERPWWYYSEGEASGGRQQDGGKGTKSYANGKGKYKGKGK